MSTYAQRYQPLVICLGLASLVGACSLQPANKIEKAAEPWQLRSYPVSAPLGHEVRSILVKLIPEGEQGGRVVYSPNGQLLVAAPASFHTGVETFLQTLKTTPPSPPPTVRLKYWVLLGRPSEAFNAGDVDTSIHDSVTALAASAGTPAMEFKQLEALTLVSTSGEPANLDGLHVQIRQSASAFEHEVMADLRIQPVGPGNSISTRVHLPLGKVLVLGQAGLIENPRSDAFTGKSPLAGSTGNASVFYLLKAELL